MSDFDRNIAAARGGYGADRALAIDAGLRAYMIRVYNLMAGGIAFTGIAAWLTYQAAGGDAIRRVGGGLTGTTAFGRSGARRLHADRADARHPGPGVLPQLQDRPAAADHGVRVFTLYAGLMGVALTSIFVVYTGVSITRVFFITAATFGAMSLYGYTTKRDSRASARSCSWG